MEIFRKFMSLAACAFAATLLVLGGLAMFAAAPVLGVAGLLMFVGALILMDDRDRQQFLVYLRLVCGEPSYIGDRVHSCHAEVLRAAGIDLTAESRARDAWVGSQTTGIRPEGDEKHDSPPVELREASRDAPNSLPN